MQAIDSLLVPVYKPLGKTPLECVEVYKLHHHIDPSITVSYAGRLDPMAEGVLLLLVGDTNKNRREYEHMSKEYEVTVLVGFATDTGDLMGKLIIINDQLRITNLRKQLEEVLPLFIGAIEQRYPIYSSAKVRGRPLYWWARKGRLGEIEQPTHKVQINNIDLISEDTITNEALQKYITESVGSVKGDFRQEEIIKEWKKTLSMSSRPPVTGMEGSLDFARDDKQLNASHQELSLFTLRITCGSGTYMRQLVADIGEKLGILLCAFKIKRTRVGEYR